MRKSVLAICGILAVLVVIGLLFAFVFLDVIVKKGVETVGPAITKVDVLVADVNLSMLSGQGELQDLFVGNPEGFKTASAIKVGSVAIAVDPGSVFSDKVIVRSIKIEAPELTIEGSLKGNNLTKILENVKQVTGESQTSSEGAKNGTSKKLQVDDLLISGGKVNVSATMLGGKAASLPLPEIRLSELGLGPDGITPAELVTKILDAMLSGTAKAVASNVGDLGKGAIQGAEDLGKGTVDQLNKATKSVGDLFKKK